MIRLYVLLAISLLLYAGIGAVITWLLFRVACCVDDVRYLADAAQANGSPVERRKSPLRYAIVVAGIFAVPTTFCLLTNINPLGWL